MERIEISGYGGKDAELTSAHDYLLPTVLHELTLLQESKGAHRLFDLGCGNGSVANVLTKRGWKVIGVDSSKEGIMQANSRYSQLELHEGSAYDNLVATYGQFPVVTSLEVVEHVYYPRRWATTVFSLLESGGTAIISTPYHGYWKNLALGAVYFDGPRQAVASFEDHRVVVAGGALYTGFPLSVIGFDVVDFSRWANPQRVGTEPVSATRECHGGAAHIRPFHLRGNPGVQRRYKNECSLTVLTPENGSQSTDARLGRIRGGFRL